MIYLDHNATTPVAPEVKAAMMPYFSDDWGNPSSSYRFGAKLKAVIETAREQVAELLSANPTEIQFTCCATESNNAAIHAALKADSHKRHIVTSVVEHSSVLNYCLALEKEGFRVTYLPVDRDGLIKLADLDRAISNDTAVVSLMWANNETGVLFPIEEIARTCESHGVLFHCDGVQVVGKVPIDLDNMAINYFSVTGHKFNAPKGVGALYVRHKTPFRSFLYGGHQERGLRGGTENVALIAGLGKAAELARRKSEAFDTHVRPLRDALEEGILSSIPETDLNGHKLRRLPNTTNITFHDIESEALLVMLDQQGICVSTGSACVEGSDKPSHVIAAMKPGRGTSRDMIRFSLGNTTTQEEVETTLAAVRAAVEKLRP